MTIEVKHPFVSAVPDGPDPAKVRATDWNAAHTLTQAGQRMLGKATAGAGSTTEMTAADVLSFAGAEASGAAAAAVAAHEAAGDPHTGYALESAAVLDGDTASGDLAGTYPAPTVTLARGLRETAGPTTLAMGAVADGEFLKRSGSTLVGGTASGGASEIDTNDQSGNYTIVNGDRGKIVRATGSSAQTFTTPAAATVGDKWWCYYENASTGTTVGAQKLTIDGNAAETVNGGTTDFAYLGEFGILYTDGTNWFTEMQRGGVLQILNADSPFTFDKPSTLTECEVELWGGGAGGGSGRKGAAASARAGGGGGGGGACVFATYRNGDLSASTTVTIAGTAAGGPAQATNSTNGTAGTVGGNSTFGSLLTAYGGGAGAAGTNTTVAGGSGGGWLTAANGTTQGAPAINTGGATGQFGGGLAAADSVGSSAALGGAAGGGTGVTTTARAGGCAVRGGAGGGGGGGITSGNANQTGGAGGSGQGATSGGGGAGGAASTNGTAGTAGPQALGPGTGGGGGGGNGGAGGAGGIACGGGGGGAGVDSTTNSGAGGTGGAGLCRIRYR